MEKDHKREQSLLEEKRAELIRLSEKGDIKTKVPYLKKAPAKFILRAHAEHEIAEREVANEVIAESLVDKFGVFLESVGMVDSGDALADDLQRDKLFKKDVKSIVRIIGPWIPYLGLLSGGLLVGKHMYNKTSTNEPKPDREEPEPEQEDEEIDVDPEHEDAPVV